MPASFSFCIRGIPNARLSFALLLPQALVLHFEPFKLSLILLNLPLLLFLPLLLTLVLITNEGTCS